MKSHIIKTLTVELLIVELPYRTADFSVLDTGDALAVCAFTEQDECIDVKGIPKGHTLLGKPDEIKDEDAEKLFYNPIDSTNLTHYANLRNLFSLLESEIYWENPLGEEPRSYSEVMDGVSNDEIYEDVKDWHAAQEKTFDRNRSIILVKI